jgi:hypothetical protein
MFDLVQILITLLGELLDQLHALAHPPLLLRNLRRNQRFSLKLAAFRQPFFASRYEGLPRLLGQPLVELRAKPSFNHSFGSCVRRFPMGARGNFRGLPPALPGRQKRRAGIVRILKDLNPAGRPALHCRFYL